MWGERAVVCTRGTTGGAVSCTSLHVSCGARDLLSCSWEHRTKHSRVGQARSECAVHVCACCAMKCCARAHSCARGTPKMTSTAAERVDWTTARLHMRTTGTPFRTPACHGTQSAAPPPLSHALTSQHTCTRRPTHSPPPPPCRGVWQGSQAEVHQTNQQRALAPRQVNVQREAGLQEGHGFRLKRDRVSDIRSAVGVLQARLLVRLIGVWRAQCVVVRGA